ncbi:MAG: MBL fold metallo-hydrolase [Methylophilaceae bacterium]
MPRIDYVLISHNHYDHLDLATVQKLMQRPQPPIFLVPAGVEQWFHQNVTNTVLNGAHANVKGLQWWQEVEVQGQQAMHKIRFLPVQHWSARGLFDRYETLWGSWAVLSPHFNFWFSGDLGYSADIRDIHANIGDVDLAAIAIGGYAPRWFMQRAHIDPDEAVQVMQDLHAKQALAIHWGTFALTDEPMDEPPKRLQQALQQQGIAPQRFRVLRHGESMTID